MKNIIRVSAILIAAALSSALPAVAGAGTDVVLIVNAANPTTATGEDIKRILLGRLNQFPGSGVAVPMLRSTRWELWQACTEKFIGKSPSDVERNWATRVFSGQSEPPKVIFTDEEAVQAVANNASGITCVAATAIKGKSTVRVLAP